MPFRLGTPQDVISQNSLKERLCCYSLVPSVSPNLDKFLFREIIFEVVPLLSNNIVSRRDMGDAKRMLRTTRKATLLSSQNSFRDLCGTGGVQLGNTKVFFRQVSRPMCVSVCVFVFVQHTYP